MEAKKIGKFKVRCTIEGTHKPKEKKGKKDVKLGARIIGEHGLNKLIPNYTNIFTQIEEIREVATQYNEEIDDLDECLSREREFYKHFDNIFSILGERGSGKTSVMITLKYLIMNSSKCADLFLPVIMPEDMEASSDILGWLIVYLNTIVNDIEKQLARKQSCLSGKEAFEEYFDPCFKKHDTPLRKIYREMKKAYLVRRAEYRSIVSKNFIGLEEYIESSSDILASDQELMNIFQKFLRELIKVKRGLNDGYEPLLYIFFDDVDMCTERCYEILNTIMRYLAYPNIVIFVAGNYKTFFEVLTIEFLKRDSLLGDRMNKNYCMIDNAIGGEHQEANSVINTRKNLVQDYLLKVMPPALRYYIPYYSDKMKADFFYITEDDNKESEGKGKVTHEKLYDLIVKNFIGEENENNPEMNFLIYKYKFYSNDINESKVVDEVCEKLYSFFKIFPCNPRGLMNIYYLLYSKLGQTNIKEDLPTPGKLSCWSSVDLRQLLNIIVDSSSLLGKYKRDIYKIIDIRDESAEIQDRAFIDYDYLISLFENYKSQSKESNKTIIRMNNFIEDAITIFMLAYFFDNLLYLKYRFRYSIGGDKALSKLLNNVKSDFLVYPCLDNISLLLMIYELVREQGSDNTIRRDNNNQFLFKYFGLLEEYAIKAYGSLHNFFEKMYNLDENWTSQKIDMIMEYGGRQNRALRVEMHNTFDKLKGVRSDKEFLIKYRDKIRAEEARLFGRNVKMAILQSLNKHINKDIGNELKDYDLSILNQIYYVTNRIYLKLKELETIGSREGLEITDIENEINKKQRDYIGKELKEYKNRLKELFVSNQLVEQLKINKKNPDTNGLFDEISKDDCINILKELNLKMLYREIKQRFPDGIGFAKELEREKVLEAEIERELQKEEGEIIRQKEAAAREILKNAKISEIDKEKEINQKVNMEMEKEREKLKGRKIEKQIARSNRLEIEGELLQLLSIYENIFVEVKQAVSAVDKVIEDDPDFRNYLSKLQTTGIEQITRTIENISRILDKDHKIQVKELNKLLDLVEVYADDDKEKNFMVMYEDLYYQIKYDIREIRNLPYKYDFTDNEKFFYAEMAKQKLDKTLVDYLYVKTLLEINKRNISNLHIKLRRLKHDLVNYPEYNAITPSYFDLYVREKEQRSLKVILDV